MRRTHDPAMAIGDFSDPGGVGSVDPGGATTSQGAAASVGPRGIVVATVVGTRAFAGPTGAVASVGTTGALVMVA